MISLLVEAAARSLALGLIVWLALAIARSRNIHLHKAVWMLVLLASLVMPFLLRAHVAPVIHAPESVMTLVLGHGVQGTNSSLRWMGGGITGLYGVVVLMMFWRYAAGLWGMARIRREARRVTGKDVVGENETAKWPAILDVRMSSKVATPATFGSTILLPAEFSEWSGETLRAVISHEQSHVAHGDCYTLWLARLHMCVFWFSPLAWWIQRRLAILAETTSDEAAVATLGDSAAYAEILLAFAKRQPAHADATALVATAMARPLMATRIERIISGIAPSMAPKLSQRLWVVAAILPLVAAAAAPVQSSSVDSGNSKPPSERSPVGNPDPNAARVLGWPEDGLKKFYPPEALQAHIEGVVVIRVTLDTSGRPTDTLIQSEEPLDQGFGAAASSLAHEMAFANPTGQPAQISFKVKFAL